MASILGSYGASDQPQRHPIDDPVVLAGAAAIACGVWQRSVLAIVLVGASTLLWRRRWRLTLCCAAIALLGAVVGSRALDQAQPRDLGPYSGWVTVAADPAAYGAGVRVTITIDDERFDAWFYGGSRRRVLPRQVGDLLWVEGNRLPRRDGDSYALVRHVVGRFSVDHVGDWMPGSRISVANGRVRAALREAAESTMPADDAALFTGLVIGDDSRQSSSLVADFRASGLSHLTAVSGSNVAYVLAAASPALQRLRPTPRWTATVMMIVWFMALTRFEPSVLRAGCMAILAVTAYTLGLPVSPVRLLGLAVGGLLLVDPFLVWSVGFWLSVGATAGVIVIGPRLAATLGGPLWLRLPLGITIGAQLGVAIPSLLVFGRLPLVSLVANVLAVPVAGFVMLYGLPAGLLASAVPALAAPIMAPARAGTRWVNTVARIAAWVEPSPGWAIAGWLVIATMAGAVWAVRRRCGNLTEP